MLQKEVRLTPQELSSHPRQQQQEEAMRYVSDGSCERRWGEEGHASTRGPIFRSCSGGHPPEAHYPKRVLDGWTTGRLKGNMAAQLGRFSEKVQ